jgi:hypothetical protein
MKVIVAGAVLAVIGLIVDLAFIGKMATHSFPVHWSITGQTPWGTAQRDETTGVPVVLWSPVRGGYCYEAVFSTDLRDRLAARHTPTVVVDYNVFSDFGRPRRHTVRAVDGITVDEKSRQDSGMMETSRDHSSAEPPDCEARLVTDR